MQTLHASPLERRFADENSRTKICNDEYLAIPTKICGYESLRDEIVLYHMVSGRLLATRAKPAFLGPPPVPEHAAAMLTLHYITRQATRWHQRSAPEVV